MVSAPVVFTIPEPPPPGGTQQSVLGDDRWLWWWAPGDRLSTVSAEGRFRFPTSFAKVAFQGPAVEYTGITTTGPLFLMEEFLLDDGGGIHAQERTQTAFRQRRRTWRRRTRTTTTGQPAFANSHVGFMRGIGRKGLNLYDSVELWATLYSTNPTNLIPELIAPLSFTSMPVMLGGWGDLATVDTAPPEGGMAVGIGPLVASR